MTEKEKANPLRDQIVHHSELQSEPAGPIRGERKDTATEFEVTQLSAKDLAV